MSTRLLIATVLCAFGLSFSATAQNFGLRIGPRGVGIHYDSGPNVRVVHDRGVRPWRFRGARRAWAPGRVQNVCAPRYRWVIDECGRRVRVRVPGRRANRWGWRRFRRF